MAHWGWHRYKKPKHYGMEKKHMVSEFVNLVTSYVRPIKAVD